MQKNLLGRLKVWEDFSPNKLNYTHPLLPKLAKPQSWMVNRNVTNVTNVKRHEMHEQDAIAITFDKD